MENLDPFILGETSQVIDFDSSSEHQVLASHMASQALQSLRLLTPDLEAAIYDSEPFLHALTRLATRSKYAKIEILLSQSMRAVKNGHRIIELARRFPTYIHIHSPAAEHRGFSNSVLIADERGYIEKNSAERYEGTASFNDPLKVRELTAHFRELWGKSAPDSELRRLHI